MAPLAGWIVSVSGWLAVVATWIIVTLVVMHLKNYRKPFEQRLMIRIQLIVPLFAASCYSMLVNPHLIFNRFMLEPMREIYEAFVIYTFFSLLTLMLGGERNIIIRTLGREPLPHPPPLKWIMPTMDILDPYTLLNIKRGILQYVWLKPFICFATLGAEVLGFYNIQDSSATSVYLWLTILYNCLVLLSLYCLALFWKILWSDLKPFDPVGKFLCVKLIIFALYWQGVILAIASAFKLLPVPAEGSDPIGPAIQNALLCVELILFAIGHWFSFLYRPFTIAQIPNGRLRFWNAVKDCFGVKDLVYDFQLTFHGDYYQDYKKFDSVEALIAHPDSSGRMSRINRGLRYHPNGKIKHWLPVNEWRPEAPLLSSEAPLLSTSEAHAVNIQHLNSGSPFSQFAPSPFDGTSSDGIAAGSSSAVGSSAAAASSSTSSAFIAQLNDLNHGSVDYLVEDFEGDELLYENATLLINNYNIDQPQVERLINYPIVDEMLSSHVYGYKVRKLRQERERTYGSV